MHREGEVRMGAGPKGLPDPWPDLGPHPSPASAHPTGSQGHRPQAWGSALYPDHEEAVMAVRTHQGLSPQEEIPAVLAT